MSMDETKTITDSMSERELQRIARAELTVALDQYLKRKRAVSRALENNQASSESIPSVNTFQSDESMKSNPREDYILQEKPRGKASRKSLEEKPQIH